MFGNAATDRDRGTFLNTFVDIAEDALPLPLAD
jgi:hypothetical protein